MSQTSLEHIQASLHELVAVGRALGSHDRVREAEALRERLLEGRFFVACVGQFKRGKSTLLNALVGAAVLPTGVVPVTSIVTVVRYGAALEVRVHFAGRSRQIDPSRLVEYVSEQGNPRNAAGVTGVEVFLPSPVLCGGLCLVDTPGLSSPLGNNTETTRAFLPQLDAVLLVVGADPPLSGDEVSLVEAAARDVESIIVVLNKADRTTTAERREAAAFATGILGERLGRPVGPVFEVSALGRLHGAGEERDWARLTAELERLAAEKGAALVQAAGVRGAAVLARRLAAEIGERRRALTLPLAASEGRLQTLRVLAGGAAQTLRELGHLLAAEQEAIDRELDARREAFVCRSLLQAGPGLLAAVAASRAAGRGLHADAVALAQATARTQLEGWRVEEQAATETAYASAAQRFVTIANGFLERLTAAGTFGTAGPGLLGPEHGLRHRSQLFYRDAMDWTGQALWRWLTAPVLPRRQVVAREQRFAHEYLRHLLETNAARVMNDLKDRVLESRRQLEAEVRNHLVESLHAAERAVDAARSAHTQGHAAVTASVAELAALQARLDGGLIASVGVSDLRLQQGASS